VATAGNDHRLGAQEAPPAIISWPGQKISVPKITHGSLVIDDCSGELFDVLRLR